MRKLTLMLSTLGLLFTFSAPGEAQHREFFAKLTGDQEVAAGHPTAKGRFRITFDKDFTEGRFHLRVDDLDGVTRAHLHCNVAGQNGPIFIHLIGDMPLIGGTGPGLTPQNIDGKWLSHTAITNQSFSTTTTDCGDTLQELATAAEAGMVYVNVHTNDFPAGAIRGQLEKD
jgi:hypothetical protein